MLLPLACACARALHVTHTHTHIHPPTCTPPQVTLFHEMGHMFHHLLGRTEIASFAGARPGAHRLSSGLSAACRAPCVQLEAVERQRRRPHPTRQPGRCTALLGPPPCVPACTRPHLTRPNQPSSPPSRHQRGHRLCGGAQPDAGELVGPTAPRSALRVGRNMWCGVVWCGVVWFDGMGLNGMASSSGGPRTRSLCTPHRRAAHSGAAPRGRSP